MPTNVLPARTRWTTLIAVCAKCDGGKRLAKVLRSAQKQAGRRDVRVVRSTCLDVCPKRGVTVVKARAGTVQTLVVPDGAADVSALLS